MNDIFLVTLGLWDTPHNNMCVFFNFFGCQEDKQMHLFLIILTDEIQCHWIICRVLQGVLTTRSMKGLFFPRFSFFNTCKKRTTRSRETFIDQWELNSLDQNLTDGPLHRIYGFIRSFGLDRGIDLGLQVEKLSKIYGHGSSQRQIQDFKTVVHHKKIGLCRGILLRCHVGEYTTLCHDVFGLSIAIHSDSLLYRELFLTDCMCGAIPIQGFIWSIYIYIHFFFTCTYIPVSSSSLPAPQYCETYNHGTSLQTFHVVGMEFSALESLERSGDNPKWYAVSIW